MQGPRIDRLSWDEYFMMMAMIVAQRSEDPSTQVGAIVVNAKNVVVGTGYNGFPRGIDSRDFSWEREGQKDQTKYPYVCHAEENAVYNSGGSLEDCRIYCTLFPCNECAKPIIQTEIKEIIYLQDRPDDELIIMSKRLLGKAGVTYRPYLIAQERLTTIFVALTKML